MAKKSPSFSGNPALVGLGAAIRAARKAKGLSQEALAEIPGIDRSYMGGIERGEHNLAIMNFLKVASALGIKASLLLDETGNLLHRSNDFYHVSSIFVVTVKL